MSKQAASHEWFGTATVIAVKRKWADVRVDPDPKHRGGGAWETSIPMEPGQRLAVGDRVELVFSQPAWATYVGFKRKLAMNNRVARRFLLRQLTAKTTRNKVAINLSKELPTLWYENDKGDRFVPDPHNPFASAIPEGFVYQHSRFPSVLVENVLRLITPEDVQKCGHEEVLIDHGLIEGLEGRMCRQCGGSQTKKVGAEWPATWDAYGSRDVMSGSNSYPTDLILAMVRPSTEEIRRAAERGHEIRPVNFDRAVILAATSCERCLNVLLWRHGLNDGYEEFSPQWKQTRTHCELCKP